MINHWICKYDSENSLIIYKRSMKKKSPNEKKRIITLSRFFQSLNDIEIRFIDTSLMIF